MVKIKEIMRKYVITTDPSFTLDAVAKIMSNNRIGSVVITSNDKPIGIVTTEDIVFAVSKGKDPKKTKISEFSKRKFITASPEDSLIAVTKTMLKEGIKRVPIIKNGRLEGIVTDKEILLTTPELLRILSEKLKARVENVARATGEISGICEDCSEYSDDLRNTNGRWYCEGCREKDSL